MEPGRPLCDPRPRRRSPRAASTRAEVLEILARAYARQIFVDGLFHADPHPGNLFVLDEPEAAERPARAVRRLRAQQRLAPELARELRLGMLALLARDLDAFVAGMQRMDMIAPGAEPRVRAAVGVDVRAAPRRLRPAPLALGSGRMLALKDEAKALLYETPGLALPSDLLLYAKTLSYLFALGARARARSGPDAAHACRGCCASSRARGRACLHAQRFGDRVAAPAAG